MMKCNTSFYRNTIIGLTATSARVGGILAPFCAQLDHIFPDLNLIVLGIGSLLAGVSVFKGKYGIDNKLYKRTILLTLF